MSVDPKKFGLSKSLIDAVNEALHPNQKKLDVADPKGKLDAKDFKKLRGEGSKSDFLDLDKDGNKTEPMKKASKEVKEEADLEENKLYHVSWGSNRDHQVVAKHGEEAVSKAKAAILKKNPKLQDKKYSDAFDKKPTVTNLSHERKVQKEEALDEKAVSQAQQKAAGAALATQRGEYAGGKKGGAVNRMALMKASELRKIAATKRTGLPMRKEETELDEADSYSIKNTKTDNTYHISKYPITSNHSIYKKIKAKDPQAQIHKNGQPMKEEVEEIDELSKGTLGSYVKKASSDMAVKLRSGSEFDNKASAIEKQTNRGNMNNYASGREAEKNRDKAYGGYLKRKRGITKAVDKLTKEEVEVTEADDAIAKQIAAKKDAMQKQIRQKIAQKQMSVLQQKAQKKIQTIKAGTEKCSCGSTNESKMKCEVHGGNMNGIKGGKEAITVNPPLREASKTKY